MVQNYFIEYTDKTFYKDGFFNAWTKYVGIGFCSMISYDIFKKIKDTILGNQVRSKFWLNRALLRGINGSIFCSTSRLIKEKITEWISQIDLMIKNHILFFIFYLKYPFIYFIV